MTFVNVHSGVSDNKGPTSRGSRGCVTIHPDDAEDFFQILNGIKIIQIQERLLGN